MSEPRDRPRLRQSPLPFHRNEGRRSRGILVRTALCLAVAAPAAGQPGHYDRTEVGIERAASRADTMRTALAIHREAGRQACGTEPDVRMAEESRCFALAPGSATTIHPYWTWVLLLLECLCAVAAAVLTFTRHRTSSTFRILVCALPALTLVQAADAVAGDARAADAHRRRLARAELQWRLDFARAGSLEDASAGPAALDAAQRYATAVARR